MRFCTPLFLPFLVGIILTPLTTNAQWWTLNKLHSIVNDSSTDELRPVLSSDGTKMFFTRQGASNFNRSLIENGVDLSLTLDTKAYNAKLKEIYSSLSGQNNIDPHLSAFNQDIWVLTHDQDGFSSVSPLESPINNAFPNSMCSLRADGKEAILINQFPEEGGIKKGFSIIKKRKDGSWSSPFALSINGLGNIEPDVNVALSDDGNYLVLSLNRRDSYSNSNDLYTCKRINETTFGEPDHLGPAINGAYHEAAPFLTAGGSKLFFSSNRRGGKGGSDIYYVERIGSGWNRWTSPMLLSDPINSSADESHPYFIEKTGELYFSSKRDGSSDIFKIQIAPKESNLVEIAGVVRGSDNRKPMKAVVLSRPAGSRYLREVVETKDGAFSMKIPKGKLFEIQAQKNGYLTASEQVKFDNHHVFFNAVTMDFEMEAATEGHQFVVNNINFKRSTSELLASSEEALKDLAVTLINNPFLNIEIIGHTDNQGSKEELFQLSRERSEAIKNYLVFEKGISTSRLRTSGVGDTMPLNLNKDELQRKKNRRVEIKILQDNSIYTLGSN